MSIFEDFRDFHIKKLKKFYILKENKFISSIFNVLLKFLLDQYCQRSVP